jgi:20S proteasome subunit alpha 4
VAYGPNWRVQPLGSKLLGACVLIGLADPCCLRSQANAVGRNSKSLLEFLETRYKPELTEAETVRLAVQTLLEVRPPCWLAVGVRALTVLVRAQVVESGAKSMELAVLRFKQPIQFLEEAAITPIVAAVEAEQESEAKRKEADE